MQLCIIAARAQHFLLCNCMIGIDEDVKALYTCTSLPCTWLDCHAISIEHDKLDMIIIIISMIMTMLAAAGAVRVGWPELQAVGISGGRTQGCKSNRAGQHDSAGR